MATLRRNELFVNSFFYETLLVGAETGIIQLNQFGFDVKIRLFPRSVEAHVS